jgi:predicted translin family RNA/ssDNA-binding protein
MSDRQELHKLLNSMLEMCDRAAELLDDRDEEKQTYALQEIEERLTEIRTAIFGWKKAIPPAQ